MFYSTFIYKNLKQSYAEVAHLVEHDLAKVGVAGSSPVFRSKILLPFGGGFFLTIYCPGGGPDNCRDGRYAQINFGVIRNAWASLASK